MIGSLQAAYTVYTCIFRDISEMLSAAHRTALHTNPVSVLSATIAFSLANESDRNRT